ncbi:MAG: cupin domain-containing protein [Caldilineaceae bacterium SB0661_bin_32]|uniref:Cupin domain-containing protein n=1 Tax=Caldilineaceae bacterium SB0661_bin_32 TaxID=2605255 RepID=A0A6B1D6N7_9CHLR|nr:cupin domain-containing protein [Caldilineaceae bacterium SB0661_bin_32]
MATLLSASKAAAFKMGKGDSRNLVGPSTGAQDITLNYSVFQADEEFPQHFHEESADIFIVLEGGVSVRQGDAYTPITSGQFAYVPSPEVHGTVNTSGAEATLISFQAPPDQALYKGERDPSKTGTTPRPPDNHRTTVRIDNLASGIASEDGMTKSWAPASPATGTPEMRLDYFELGQGGNLEASASEDKEAVWFVWRGEVSITAGGETLRASRHEGAFIPSGEAQTVRNDREETARLIRCQAI